MFGEKTMQSSTVLGTSAYTLNGSVGAFKTWRSQLADASPVFYFAENEDGTIWEAGYGTLTYGSPDSISRTLISSSTGSLVSWSETIYVMSIPSAAALKHLLAPLASSRPAWLPAGGTWLDTALGLAVTWIKKVWTGTVNIEEGRFDIANGVYYPGQRNQHIDKAGTSATMVATDAGAVIGFDLSSSGQVYTLLAGATAGIGAGFKVWVYGYGGTGNYLTVTPNGSELIDSNNASLIIPAWTRVMLQWDPTKSGWRTDYGTPAPAATLASASTLNLKATPAKMVDVSGTTTITAVTLANGDERTIRATGDFTLTHGASLVLPGATNAAIKTGDYFTLTGYASGVVRMSAYLPASGGSLFPTVQQDVLGSDVTLGATGVFSDGPTLTLGVGTWLLFANANVSSGTDGNQLKAKVWDGTTVYGSGTSVGRNEATGTITPVAIAMMGYVVVASGTKTVKISACTVNYTGGKILANGSGGAHDSQLTAVRVG